MRLLPNFKSVMVLLGMLIIQNSCSSDEEAPVDCTSSTLQASVDAITDASCGLNNGQVELTITGGLAPYEFRVTGSGFQSIQAGTSEIERIPSGSTTLTVRDGQSCTVTATLNVLDVNNLTIDTQLEAAGCETSNGTIIITALGGKEPYNYSLDGGASQSDNNFSGLAVGDYTALVTDDDGCQTSVTVSVLSGVSYNDEIIPIINENCAINACHDGSNSQLPNWTILVNIRENAQNIKTRTLNETMPPDASMDPEKIQAIACWIDDGALDN